MAPASFPARRMAPAPLAGAALALLLLVSALPAPASAQIDFCGAISNITNQCANPSTEDAVNLGLFAGKWYVAGATAGWAFLPYTILGGQCATVKYTSIGRQLLREAISVVNANLRVLDDNARGQVGAISLSTQALGGGLEQLCDAVAAPSLDSISALVDRILKVTGAGAASDLVENAKAIQTSIATISTRAGSIDSILGSIQLLNNLLNGFGLPVPIDIAGIQAQLFGLLAQVDAFLALITQQQAAILGAAAGIKKLTPSSVAKSAATSIQKIAGKTGTFAKSIGTMTSARNALKKMITKLGSKTGAVSTIVLNNTATPVDSVTKLNKAFAGGKISKGSTVKNKAPLSTLKKIGNSLFSILSGKALQDRKNKGRFSIDLGTLKGAPYSIVKLTGKASAGYASALIYLCSKDPSGSRPIINNLLVLTRAPTDANAALINDAIQVAKNLGIYLGGDNPLLQIAQNPTLCSILNPLD